MMDAYLRIQVFFLEVILEVNNFMIHGRKFFDQTIKDDIET